MAKIANSFNPLYYVCNRYLSDVRRRAAQSDVAPVTMLLDAAHPAFGASRADREKQAIAIATKRPGRFTAFTPVTESFPIPIFSHAFYHTPNRSPTDARG